jgi:benzoyl-CoA reductase/2-hydroxyglutaryl-CoA dehydratase subunit BcrC/BadD/HgdB
MAELGVPYLSLETDYSQSDAGQLSTRLEAFLERL